MTDAGHSDQNNAGDALREAIIAGALARLVAASTSTERVAAWNESRLLIRGRSAQQIALMESARTRFPGKGRMRFHALMVSAVRSSIRTVPAFSTRTSTAISTDVSTAITDVARAECWKRLQPCRCV